MDATQRSLEMFDNPALWARVESDVPIFVEHVARDKQGKELYRVDR